MIIVPGSFAQFPFTVRMKEEDLVKVPYCTEIEAVMFTIYVPAWAIVLVDQSIVILFYLKSIKDVEIPVVPAVTSIE